MTALLARNRAPARPHRAGRWLLSGIAAGAGFAFLFDPARGRLRRERIAAALRHTRRRLGGRARAAALQTIGRTKGALHELRPPAAGEPLDDTGLAHKVESVLFGDPLVPKGKLSINAEGGTVFLRGQVESQELIDDLTGSVRKIAGVREVVSLLHLPGTLAPHHE